MVTNVTQPFFYSIQGKLIEDINTKRPTQHAFLYVSGVSIIAAIAICIGAAGHYNGKTLWHENPYPYSMPFADIAIEKKWLIFNILHDYATIICATFTSYLTFLGIKSSPAYLPQRECYPLGLLQNPQHALMGSAYYAAKRLINN